MGSTSTINPACYLGMVRHGCARLRANKEVINDLNVFPIPDGDTGDNMFMTINSGCQNAAVSDHLGEVAKSISSGMLLGARGNSGVILSRIFAGIGRGLEGIKEADLDTFISAMSKGVEESYKAVSVPVEGTILTVFREGVEKASAKSVSSLEEYLGNMIPEMEASLERTPELLPTLKEAGVIDSGGAGILAIVKGMAEALESDEDVILPDNPAPEAAHGPVNLDAFSENNELQFGYCTEFLLRLQTSKVNLDTFDANEIKDYLTEAGESVVCFREGSIVKVHVHTKTPGEILNHCQRWGEFLTLKIENMALQHNENVRKKTESHEEPEFKIRKRYGVVAVASGNGIADMLKEAGADIVIEGGQTMNPPTGSFIEAFEQINADCIFVYPDNSNIILTALQAASLYEKAKIVVIPSKNVGAGYVAIASLDKSEKDVDALIQSQKQIIDETVCAVVSRANRDAQMDGVKVQDGHYIGILGGEILTDNPSADNALIDLCEKTGIQDHDVALLFYGQDVSEEQAQNIYETLSSRYPDTEFMLTNGGQPIYDYILTLC